MNNRLKRIINWSLSIIITLGILISIFLYFNPPTKLALNDLQAKVELPYVEEYVDETTMNDNQMEVSWENIQQASYEDIGASGQLVIPQPGVEISLPIVQGIGYYNMFLGAGEQMHRSIVKPGDNGNYILASHLTVWANYLFTNLPNMEVGSNIYVADKDNIYIYKTNLVILTSVNNTEYLDQPEDQTKKMITLYTCEDYGSPNRWVIQGELIETIPIDKIDNDTKVAFDYWLTLINKK